MGARNTIMGETKKPLRAHFWAYKMDVNLKDFVIFLIYSLISLLNKS